LIVVGGTYAERVTVPDHQDDAAGSGMRAAAALRSAGVELVTAVDRTTAAAASAAAAAFGMGRKVSTRDQPVGFRYFTPVSDPAIDGPGAQYSDDLVADDEAVLVFGMVEKGALSVRAEKLVIDPQRPRDLSGIDFTALNGDRVAIVANAREAAALAGHAQSTAEMAFTILEKSHTEIVVVKAAGRGCTVVTQGSAEAIRVGPHPTPTVWPLGSGDVFTAGFAHAWAHGADAVEAARVASSSAAWWCGTRQSALPTEILAGTSVEAVWDGAGVELPVPDRKPLVYIAAPFFTLAERWLVETCRDVLVGLGARVFSPLHQVGPGGDEVAARDLEGLRNSNAVLALLDGWDPGTLYEVGWAHRHQLPVVGFVNSPGNEGTKMLVGTGAEIHEDLSSALYRSVWAAQGLPVSGGRVSQ
jgi:hypothetical protein